MTIPTTKTPGANSRSSRKERRTWFPLLVLPLSFLTGCGNQQEATVADVPPPEVDVAMPLKHRLVEWDEYAGRFTAIRSAEIRSRVTGYLIDKKFNDGQLVEKGDVLFVIDPREFRIELERAEAQHELAKKNFDRISDIQEGAVSKQEADERLQAQRIAESNLKDAELQLEFTEIRAPFAGRVSDAAVDIGNLVRENETILTSIVSVDPIHFEFDGSEGQFLETLRLDRAGKRPSSITTANPIFIKLMDEEIYEHAGRMVFVDNQIDAGTGTMRAQAVVANPDRILYPGLFGRARLVGSGEYEAILLPENAINTDQDRKFVYTLDEENRAKRTFVVPGPILDNGMNIIREGLSGDERVVINGVLRITTAEQEVTPVLKTLEWTEIETVPGIETVPTLEELNSGVSSGETTTDR